MQRSAAPLSTLGRILGAPLAGVGIPFGEEGAASMPSYGRVEWSSNRPPLKTSPSFIKSATRRIQEGFKGIHLGMEKEVSCWSWRGSWRKEDCWSWRPLGEEKKSSSLASIGGRQSLLASLQDPSKLLPSWSSFHRNCFFALESCLGSKLLLGLGLYNVQERVSWCLILFLAVEILTSTIEVFFGSIAFHMKCSLDPSHWTWSLGRPNQEERASWYHGGRFDVMGIQECLGRCFTGWLVHGFYWLIFWIVVSCSCFLVFFGVQ